MLHISQTDWSQSSRRMKTLIITASFCQMQLKQAKKDPPPPRPECSEGGYLSVLVVGFRCIIFNLKISAVCSRWLLFCRPQKAIICYQWVDHFPFPVGMLGRTRCIWAILLQRAAAVQVKADASVSREGITLQERKMISRDLNDRKSFHGQ